MSCFTFALRPYQQEAVICTDPHSLEDAMTKSYLPRAVAACAAAVTSLMLLGSVVSLADDDKAALAFAKTQSTTLAHNVDRGLR